MARRTLTAVGAIAAVALSSLGGSAVAVAAQGAPVSGKLLNYTHRHGAKSGLLVVKIGSAHHHIIVPDGIICGEQRGQSGDPIACTSLKKFKGDTVNLSLNKQHPKVATWVSVVIKK